MRGRNYEEKIAKQGGSLNHLLSLQRYFWRYKITQGGGLNRNHKYSSSLYNDIIRRRKLLTKKAKEGGSLIFPRKKLVQIGHIQYLIGFN